MFFRKPLLSFFYYILNYNYNWSRNEEITQKRVIRLRTYTSYLTLAMSSPPCPLLHLSLYLNLSGRSGRNCFLSLPVLSGYNGSLDPRVSRGTMRMMSLPDGEHYSCPQQSLVVPLVLSLVSTLLFSRIGGVLSHQNSSTHRFPRFPPRNLCSYVMLAVFSLVFAATDIAFC